MNTSAPSIPQAKPKISRARPPRPLSSHQLWKQAVHPIIKLRKRLAKRQDPALCETIGQLEANETELWKTYKQRELAEAQAKDKGEICWTVFSPSGRSIFDRQRIVTRTPNTMTLQSEYRLSSDPVRPQHAYSDSVWTDLDRELHRNPLDLAKFQEHARYVDSSFQRYLAKGGPEAEAA